jgi:O-antigen/teichoic acid export membrane protein
MQFFRAILNDSLFKNALYLIASNLSNLTFGFFFWIVAARYYAPEEVGAISALLSAMFLISMISTLGFPTALVYYLPKDSKNTSKIINSCLIAVIAASLIFSLIFICGLDIWASPLKSELNSLELVILFMIVTTVTTVSALLSSTFIARKRASFTMTKETTFGFVKILPLPLLAGLGSIGIFLAWGIGATLAMTIGFGFLYFILKGYMPKLVIDPPIIKNMLRYSTGTHVADIFMSIPGMVLPIMVFNSISSESAGYFYIAITVAGLLYGIPRSISNSFLAESSDGSSLWDKVGKSIRFNAMLLIPGILFFMLFGKFVLHIFNPSYAENASTTLTILAITSLPLSLCSLFNAMRKAQNRISSVLKVNAAIAIITLGFAVPLMKSSGIAGAAIAYLAATTAVTIVLIYKMNNPLEFVSNHLIIKRKQS